MQECKEISLKCNEKYSLEIYFNRDLDNFQKVIKFFDHEPTDEKAKDILKEFIPSGQAN